MQCFCGCGRKVTFGQRPLNKRGERLRREMRRIEQALGVGLESPNATMFVGQANDWCGAFAEAIHLTIQPDEQQPGFTQVYLTLTWLRAGKPFVSVALIGKMVRDAGLSSAEGAARMSRGEWDPWADVEMPAPNPDGAEAEPAIRSLASVEQPGVHEQINQLPD